MHRFQLDYNTHKQEEKSLKYGPVTLFTVLIVMNRQISITLQ